jgi:hypothetical protein
MAVTCANADDVISQAVVTRPAHGVSHRLDNLDARINIEPKETLRIDLDLAVGTGVVRVVAPNGGAINSGKALEVDMAKNGRSLGFDFTAGPNPGRYTVEVTHGNVTRTFEMWAGQEPPQGKPGPKLTFTGNH